jgi:hypothetical protein
MYRSTEVHICLLRIACSCRGTFAREQDGNRKYADIENPMSSTSIDHPEHLFLDIYFADEATEITAQPSIRRLGPICNT